MGNWPLALCFASGFLAPFAAVWLFFVAPYSDDWPRPLYAGGLGLLVGIVTLVIVLLIWAKEWTGG